MTGSTVCRNCGEPLSGAFCAACGQKDAPLDPTLRDLLHDFAHETLNLDSRFIRSARKLLLSPGFLTLEYAHGRRARWVPPLRLYLIFSVIYFGLNALAPSGTVRVGVTGDDAAAELRELGFQSEQELQEAVTRAQADWTPRVMFILVPLFAWFVHVACRRSGRRYPQHLSFALHVHAAWFAGGTLAAATRLLAGRDSIVAKVISVLVLLYGLAYFVLAFRRVYGGPTGRAVLRAAAIALAYFIAIVLAVVAIVVPVVVGRR
jgi:hypothetical protein